MVIHESTVNEFRSPRAILANSSVECGNNFPLESVHLEGAAQPDSTPNLVVAKQTKNYRCALNGDLEEYDIDDIDEEELEEIVNDEEELAIDAEQNLQQSCDDAAESGEVEMLEKDD